MKYIARAILGLFLFSVLAWWIYGHYLFFTTGMFHSYPNFFTAAILLDIALIPIALMVGLWWLIREAEL